MISINSPQQLDLDNVVLKINNENKPVLFFDTCSILDILRVALPERNTPIGLDKQLIAIKDLIVDEKIICISSELCIKEFNDHCQEIINSYEQQLKKIQEPINKYLAIINNSGIFGTLPVLDLNAYSMENYFSDIAEAIINKIIFINEQATFKEAAHFRVVNKFCPAKKKGEYKDCFIWETFFQTIKAKDSQLKESYFLSSNKQDYCELPNDNDFHTDLKMELNTLNVHFLLNYSKLYYELKNIGLI